MRLTRELAITLLENRRFLLFLSIMILLGIVVDTLLKHYRLKRKIISALVVTLLTFVRLALEILLGIPFLESICTAVFMAIYTIFLIIIRKERHDRYHSKNS